MKLGGTVRHRHPVLGLTAAPLAVLIAGCGRSPDWNFETRLAAIETEQSEHPRYPLMVFGDFGSDSQPSGFTVDTYGFYIHESTKPNYDARALTAAAATHELERCFEHGIQLVRSTEASSTPPKPPYPTRKDWKKAPHPKPGVYTIVCSCNSPSWSFDVPYASAEGLKTLLLRDAKMAVDDAFKARDDSLRAGGIPEGFTLCTDELLVGSRGGDPHLRGGLLLLLPIDKGLARKGFEASIRRLLASTMRVKPTPVMADLTVTGPEVDEAYGIPLGNREDEERFIKLALDGLDAKIDQLNKAAS